MHVYSNLATSVDGKIATASRAFFPLGTPYDRALMQKLRRRADAILVGASTLRSDPRPLLARDAGKQPLNVLVSGALQGVSARSRFFTESSTRRVAFVRYLPKGARLRAFERVCELVPLARPTPRLPAARQIASELERRGVRELLIEGGGGVMWEFVAENLIDDYYLTLTPRVVGGALAPTLVDGAGFPPERVVNLKLSRCKRVGDELYLVYRKTSARG